MSLPVNSLYSLTWGDYGTSLVSAVQLLRCHGDLVDVTLAAEGRSFEAHKIVLCAASPYLLNLLKVSEHTLVAFLHIFISREISLFFGGKFHSDKVLVSKWKAKQEQMKKISKITSRKINESFMRGGDWAQESYRAVKKRKKERIYKIIPPHVGEEESLLPTPNEKRSLLNEVASINRFFHT